MSEVTPQSALSYALTGERPYDQAADVLKRLEAIGWTVTRTPKPAEPQGLGAVVEDSEGGLYVRTEWADPWDRDGDCYAWQEINAVRVLSEGVQL